MTRRKCLVVVFLITASFIVMSTGEAVPEDAGIEMPEDAEIKTTEVASTSEKSNLQNYAEEKITKIHASEHSPSCRMGYGVMNYYPVEDGYYNHQTCFWCYYFTPAHRRKYNLKLVTSDKIILSDGLPRIDFKFSNENGTYYFDPDDEEGWFLVTSSLSDDLEAHKLEGCCRDAVTCCQRNLHSTFTKPSNPDEVFCPATWDGWSCFRDTPAGERVSFACPPHAYKGQPECSLKGQKTCWPNGTWARNAKGFEETEYALCSLKNYHLTNYYWEVSMHALSMGVVAPALVILPYYKSLRAQRFQLHLNLFWALFLKAFFRVLETVLLKIPEYTKTSSLMDENTGGCKFLTFLTKFFGVAVWSWMLSESLYLHRLIVAAFKRRGKTYPYVIIGWVTPLVLCVSWAISRALVEDYQCWLGDEHGDNRHLYLITELPKLIILVINAILLANMTRVLVTQMRSVSDDATLANKRALKATMFLLPMFGLQFFVTFIVPPNSTSCTGMHVYIFAATALDGLQGVYVAVVYCYINQEVKTQVLKSVHTVFKARYTSLGTVTFDPATEVSRINSSVNHSVGT